MKKILIHLMYVSILIGVYFISTFGLSAQNYKVLNTTDEEKKSIELLKRDGASETAIDKWVIQRRLASLKGQNTTTQNSESDKLPVINATCGDMGGENGWGAWKASKGDYNNGVITFNTTGQTPGGPRFAITTGGGVDGCTPGILPGAPPIPVVSPGYGTRSIRLGAVGANGIDGLCNQGCVERLTYPFTVTAADTNFLYTYAIVLENPQNVHLGTEVPYAEIYILDGNTIIPCSHQKYTGDTSGTGSTVQAGFYAAPCPGPASNGSPNDVVYKPWSTVGINLRPYIGKTLSVVITNVDCALGGHFCHSYWDFACPPIAGNDPPFCLGNSTTLVGPISDAINPYTYKWYVNGILYTGLPNATSVSITPTPKIGDVFAVHVHQGSGCDFWIPFKPQPMSVTPDFTSTGTCGAFNFNGTATTNPAGTPIASWNWNFGGGTPNTSTLQNPTGIVYPPGTYTVTLIVISQNGCTDTVKYPVVATGPPISIPTGTSVCFNNANQFTDMSIGNSTILNWAWDFGDGNTSALQNPLHTYGTPGIFTVSLTVTNNAGCKDIQKTTVIVNPLPKANFSSVPVCFGNPTCFTNLSTISSGSIKGLSWNFGDPNSGANNISTLPAPCHIFSSTNSFSVTLTVTSDSGCQSTIVLPVILSPPPVALFSSIPVCLNVPTSFTSNSLSWKPDTIKTWNWSFGDGTNSNQTNPTHIYTTPGSFTATLVVTTIAGCKDTVDNPVIVHAPPVSNFSKPDSGCSPVYGNYTDLSTSVDGTVNNWKWSFPGGSPASSTVKNPTNIKYVTEGTYSVSLITTTTYGCVDSIELPMIEVYGWPTADFCVSPSVAPATNPVFYFCDMWSPNVAKWSWNFGDSSPLDITNTDPAHSYSTTVNQNDFYTKQICLRVETKHGCWAAICHDVELIPEFVFYIPNTFTPNADGTNEMFYGKCRGVKEYDIWVFDRWGNQIWDCHHDDKNTNWDNDYTNPRQEGLASYCKWDGMVVQGGLDMGGNSRQLAQEDVYVWKVHLTDIFNKRHTYIGHVNIVR